MKKIITIFFVALFFFGCKNKQIDFVYNTVDIIEKNALYKDSVNWKSIKQNALKKASSVKNMEEAHVLIQNVLKKLNDKHSFLVASQDKKRIENNNGKKISIDYEIINDTTGYLKIPSFVGNDSLSKIYAKKVLEKIKYIDEKEVENWVIDLRDNSGGNMWAMLLGLHPILKNGIVGYNTRDSFYMSWSLQEDGIYYNNKKRLELPKIYTLKTPIRKIAVLINDATCSSGEAVAISFIGLPNATLIGSKTCGLTTSNSTIKLSDGSLLFLNTMLFADRNKNAFGKEIIPNISSKKPLEDALIWFNN